MPIQVHAAIRHLDQNEFAEIAYRVMDHAFAVHNEMGRLFDEDIYRDAVAACIGDDSQTEVLVEVAFEDFRKSYFLDLLVAGGAVFEIKAVNKLAPAQRSQLLTYLLLTELSHGKLLNFRPERVEHEFVNTRLKLSDRTAFRIVVRNWVELGTARRPLRLWLTNSLREIGTGLDVHLYTSAVAHYYGGEATVLRETDILSGGRILGRQRIRLAAPEWAFKVTTLKDADLPHFEDHARRFLRQTNLRGFQWINIGREMVLFTTIEKE
jgi:GxxExxY protein